MTVFRLPFFTQESPPRRAHEWPILAENRWPHDGRKLTVPDYPVRQIARTFPPPPASAYLAGVEWFA